jgi:DNA-binding MarR family transcriptional regulator
MAHYHDCIVYLLAKAYQKAHANMKRRMAVYGLTPVQLLVLGALWDEDGPSAGDLSRKLGLDNATLSGVLDRMAEREWILKETDPEDRRILRVRLTQRGRDIEPRLLDERDSANEEILGNLSLEERVLLKRLLKDLKG